MDAGKAIVSGDGEWFFFSPRDRKYPNGGRPNRTAGCGYWKATGTDKPVLAGGGAQCLGVKKALVFYQGRSPKGRKTEWVMHEYRLLDHQISRSKDSMRLDDWVLCRVRNKALVFLDHLYDDHLQLQQTPTICNTADEIIIGREQQRLVPSNEALFAGGGIERHWNDDDHQDLIGGGSATASSSTAAQAGALVLESIKRKLSFHAIDELYLLHPTKRIISGTGDDHHMSPTSFSISQTDELF